MDDAQHERVGEHVRRRRLERGWTLDVAAARLGVSRRLLVQVESGQANPSLSTLLSIAAGFETPLAELLAGTGSAPSVVVQPDNDAAPVLWSGPHGGVARLLVASGGLELWDWTLEPGERRHADAHRPGSREALTVIAGVVTIALGDAEPVVLRRGQSAAFAADTDHRYVNGSARRARFHLAVHETS